MAAEDYERARKLAQKQHSSDVASGKEPYLPCLDAILEKEKYVGEQELGLLEVPLEMIVGTKTEGRKTAFASNFMPLLGAKTEFGTKWSHLYDAHQSEGIHDPVKLYEYRGKYYALEGNKRVSVLKFSDAISAMANVTRILPIRTDDKETKIYYEYVDFYKVTGLVDVWFSKEGRYKKLLKETGTAEGEIWDDIKKEDFRSIFYRFTKLFGEKNKKELNLTIADAFLLMIEMVGYENVLKMTEKEMREHIAKSLNQYEVLGSKENVTLVTKPDEEKEDVGLFQKLFASGVSKVRIAFIYGGSVEDSSWVYGHELGRKYLEQVMGNAVQTIVYDNANTSEKGLAYMKLAISSGYKVLFVTTPNLILECQKVAMEYPDVRIVNCAVQKSFSAIRTYYARMYEAKFLMGMIAGTVTKIDKIGYLADYPIYGSVSGINAFALGVAMVNPHAKIYLEWSCKKDRDYEQAFKEEGIRLISGRDLIIPGKASRKYGLYLISYDENGGEEISNLATPMYHWGKFYERIVKNIQEGGWINTSYKSTQALNYWFGFSSEVLDIICSNKLPASSIRLMEFLKKSITEETLNIFEGPIIAQGGSVLKEKGEQLTTEQIITMEWLNENVIGTIPTAEELNERGQKIVEKLGTKSPEETL